MAGELLLNMAARQPDYELTSEQLDDVKRALAEAERGEFASADDMARTWKKFGL